MKHLPGYVCRQALHACSYLNTVEMSHSRIGHNQWNYRYTDYSCIERLKEKIRNIGILINQTLNMLKSTTFKNSKIFVDLEHGVF